MATIYCKHTGDNSTGASWATAKTTLSAALTAAGAGGLVYVSNNHAETVNSLTAAGTVTAPLRIICVDDSGSPGSPTTGAVLSSSSGNQFAFYVGYTHIHGIAFRSETHVFWDVNPGGSYAKYTQCKFSTVHSGGVTLGFGNNSGNRPMSFLMKDCQFKFGGTGQRLQIVAFANVTIEGGSLEAGSAAVTAFINWASQGAGVVNINGFDLSGAATGVNIFEAASANGTGTARNMKMPASWSGSVYSGVPPSCISVAAHNIDSADTNYRIATASYTGSVVQDTGIYLDAGKYDGTTRLSYKHASSANCNIASGWFYGPELTAWNETTGSSVTATVQIVHDGAAAVKDNEVWLEVMYLGTSGYPLGTWTSDGVDVLAAGSAQTTSSETWTGDTGTGPNGSTTWNTLKLSVSFTPQEKGVVIGRVVMGVASKTVYVDPNLILS